MAIPTLLSIRLLHVPPFDNSQALIRSRSGPWGIVPPNLSYRHATANLRPAQLLIDGGYRTLVNLSSSHSDSPLGRFAVAPAVGTTAWS